jgi:hypothetical protein
MTYAQKLKDPRWQRRRLEVLEAAKWKCQRCDSSDKTLHVHHNFYRSKTEPWEYPSHALSALCEQCHELAEKDRRELIACIESIYEVDQPTVNLHAAIGLIKGLRMFNALGKDPAHDEQLTYREQAWGFARVFGGDERDLLPQIEKTNGLIDRSHVRDLWIDQLARYGERIKLNQKQVEAIKAEALNQKAEDAGLPIDREVGEAWKIVLEEISARQPIRAVFLERANMIWEAGDILNIAFPAGMEKMLKAPIAKDFARQIEKLWCDLTGKKLCCEYIIGCGSQPAGGAA